MAGQSGTPWRLGDRSEHRDASGFSSRDCRVNPVTHCPCGGQRFSVESYADSISLRALTIVTFTYLVTKLGFVVLTSPAIGRFSDAAAIFLPGWIAVVFLSWYLAPPE